MSPRVRRAIMWHTVVDAMPNKLSRLATSNECTEVPIAICSRRELATATDQRQLIKRQCRTHAHCVAPANALKASDALVKRVADTECDAPTAMSLPKELRRVDVSTSRTSATCSYTNTV